MDKEAREKIANPIDRVGNLSGDEYSLSCVRCGSINDLHQVAFRNVNKRVIGYVFACRGCEPLIFGKSLAEILDYRVRGE